MSTYSTKGRALAQNPEIFMVFFSTSALTQNDVFQNEEFKEALYLVDPAEEMGLDSVWLGESHCNPDHSALSARTKPSPPSSIRADCCPKRRSVAV